jgi:hypothetical protein
MPATLALIVAFAPQSSGFFSPVEPLVLLLDGQSGDLAVVGETGEWNGCHSLPISIRRKLLY